MKMKYIFVLIVFLSSCSPYTFITGSWKNENYGAKTYHHILVAALTGHTIARTTLEFDLAATLAENGVNSYKSLDLFPLKMGSTDSDRVALLFKLDGKNIDAILTISVLRKETESHYVPGDYYNPYMYNYYGNFWGYYSYWYPYSYSPGYYTENTIFYLEANLYDRKSDELVWSAQTKTYDLDDVSAFSKDFARTITAKLIADGILKGKS